VTAPKPLALDPSKVYPKQYKTVVPIPLPADWFGPPLTTEDLAPGAREGHPDVILARWLGRESFEKLAAADRRKIVEYHERIVPLDEVNPLLAEHLGELDRFIWFEFSGVGQLNVDAFNWFAAEFEWKCDEWLTAERTYAQNVDDWLAAERAHNGGA
jgi:hypothetical protein